MATGSSAIRIPLQVSNNCLVASLQIGLSTGILEQFGSDLLAELHAGEARGVILDLSGIEIMDLSDFENIRNIISMARLMGAPTVVCGLRPGVVASLILLGAETDDVCAARDLDMAFEILEAAAVEESESEHCDEELSSDAGP